MNPKIIICLLVGVLAILVDFSMINRNSIHTEGDLVKFLLVGIVGLICLFIGCLNLLALGVSKGVKTTAKALGADEKTASEIGAVAGGITARVAGVIVAADVIGNISDSLGNAAPSVDTSSVVTPTPDVGIDTSALAGTLTSPAMAATAMPDLSTGTDSVAVTAGAIDLSNGVDASPSLQQFDTNMDVIHSSTTIYDTNGFEQANIVQMDNNSFVVQDINSMNLGSIDVNDVTGNVTMFDTFGFQQGSITDTGTILGIDGLSDGRVVSLGNGNMVIQDNTQHTIGHIFNNGICTDELGMPVGLIKNC
ncbi:hypothetical protein [Anaerovibrio lipolyticus]|uniref:hypothetical protein n=1 Tax=Anaerovibrio lipolyticus TaxID=82374 RepID=UPI0026EC142E|nr:hypothetical protein [Anaerovibrio lipolyticus]MBE6106666.1 hypothetical protein [Anaerovibrio lipolyticus]